MENKILIFGHKNPDTDSICSSLVMERFEKNKGLDIEAVRLGNINKEIFNFTDTYSLDIVDSKNALQVLMIVLAIDAQKCSEGNH